VKKNIKKIIDNPINKFIKCCPLNVIGFPDIRPCSFKNAIQDPEKVIAPIATPNDISTNDKTLIFPTCPIPNDAGL